MSSHEIVCLSSDEDERNNLPVIISTRSVASFNSTVDIISDSDDIVNGKTEVKGGGDFETSIDDEPCTSTSEPPAKKRRAELVHVDTSKPKKTEGKILPKKSKKDILVEENKTLFDKFLTKCEEVERSGDMSKGMVKARKHFDSAQVEFISSKEFKTTLEQSLTKINKECVWGHLGEIVKQLKLYKEREGDLVGSQKEKDLMKEQLAGSDKDRFYQVLRNEDDDRRVAKLLKILKKIHKQILKLESEEVDFDEDNDSAYIMLERYKARAAKIYGKLCELTNYPEHADSFSKRKITFSGTDIPSVNRCIERFVNKNHCFPDYQDVLKLIETVNTAETLGLSAPDVTAMASKAFREIGREIKRRRQFDTEDSLYIHLDRGDFNAEVFENDPELESKLQENGKIFIKKFNEMIEDYTQRQLREQNPDKGKSENGDSANGEKSGASSANNSGDEDEGSHKEEDDESDEEASDIDKPVDEEFESDNERESEAEKSSSDEEHSAHEEAN